MGMQVYITSDHDGYNLRMDIIDGLKEYNNTLEMDNSRGILYIIDMGPKNNDFVDYPDYCHKVAKLVSLNKDSIGIVICKTGIGMSIVCNRYRGVRCALCHSEETALIAREHNNANIISLGSDIVNRENGCNIVKAFIEGRFKKGHHIDTIGKINNINNINPITLEKTKFLM